MKRHDGPVGEGFKGYDRESEDPNGIPASGNSLDSYIRPLQSTYTYEQLAVESGFMSGRLTREEAERQLDMLASTDEL